MEPKWKLGEDLSTEDNLFDGVTFDDLILAVHCNCKKITPAAVTATAKEIIEGRMTDFVYLLDNNMDAIMEAAMKGRAQYE